jgi:hypothetical protein
VIYSVIVCSVDDTRFASISSVISQRLDSTAYEIIRIPDARSMADGYTRGTAQSRGDRLIFCHDDIEILNSDFAQRLDENFKRFDLIGVAGASRVVSGRWVGAGPPWIFGQVAGRAARGGITVAQYGVPMATVPGIKVMDGLFLASRREVAERVGFDAQTFDGFHLYDLDFTFASYLAGYRLAVATDIHLYHHSMGSYDQEWQKYVTRFEQKYSRYLDSLPSRKFSYRGALVKTKEQAANVMRTTSDAVRLNPAAPDALPDG